MVWASPNVRSDWTTPEIRVQRYKVLPELSLIDPFEAVEQEVLNNKKESVGVLSQPPSLISTPTGGPPMAGEGPVHTEACQVRLEKKRWSYHSTVAVVETWSMLHIHKASHLTS